MIYMVFSHLMRIWLEKERTATFDQFMRGVEKVR